MRPSSVRSPVATTTASAVSAVTASPWRRRPGRGLVHRHGNGRRLARVFASVDPRTVDVEARCEASITGAYGARA